MIKRPSKETSLATVNPKLASEWHNTLNGNLTPLDVTAGSNKKVWWKCDKGEDHEWEASIKSRNAGRGCSICSGKKVVKSVSLGFLNPKLTEEWHPSLNGVLTPNDVSIGSNKKVWWKCKAGEDHEWEASVDKRNNGQGCTICAGKK